MLELYHYDRSTAAQKIRIQLAEKGIEWTSRNINTSASKREHQTPEYLKINPRGLVPTLVHDGVAIPESQVILEYIEDAFPGHPLKPADPAGKARMRLWTKLIDEGLHVDSRVLGMCIVNRHIWLRNDPDTLSTYYSQMVEDVRRRNDKINIEQGLNSPLLPHALLRFKKTFRAMDEALRDSEWLAGDMMTIADISFVVYLNRLNTFQMSSLWEDMTNLLDWEIRLKALPSWYEGVTKWGDTTSEDRVNYGTEALPRVRELWDECDA
jgi:glutathione S-transferase